MSEIGELNQETAATTGDKVYEAEGVNIRLGWEKFAPKEPKAVPADEAMIVLPGWRARMNTKPVTELGRAFADNSHIPTYVITAVAEQTINDSLNKEAETIMQFLLEKGIKKVTLAGYSEEASRVINLAVLLQERQKIDPDLEVKGLILMEPFGLYEQDSKEMSKRFAHDSLVGTPLATAKDVGEYAWRKMQKTHRPIKALAESWRVNHISQTLKIGGAALFNLLREIGPMTDPRQLIHPESGYWQRVGAQAKAMSALNPRISQVRAPVIIITGARNVVISHKEIVPDEIEEQVVERRQKIVDLAAKYPKTRRANRYRKARIAKIFKRLPYEDARGKFLKENLFTSSPIVMMAVAKKAGGHELPLFRTHDVARVGLGLLERAKRQLEAGQLQKPAP
ncbi:MAG: hypothetical protein Q7R82_00530 [Candidatus Daviesbacteria bacterium]|nr:hypothetical protein [Candidatus Daviesbacteria bacterium]